MTCAHVDIAPQLELAHGLWGTKFLGVSAHEAAPRLLGEHAADGNDAMATSVPTDRPLRPAEASLLTDKDITLAALRPGDLMVFSSAALHFASNGADGLNAALYHGLVSKAALPRLRAAAQQQAAEGEVHEADEERTVLSAADVLDEILGPSSGSGETSR